MMQNEMQNTTVPCTTVTLTLRKCWMVQQNQVLNLQLADNQRKKLETTSSIITPPCSVGELRRNTGAVFTESMNLQMLSRRSENLSSFTEQWSVFLWRKKSRSESLLGDGGCETSIVPEVTRHARSQTSECHTDMMNRFLLSSTEKRGTNDTNL